MLTFHFFSIANGDSIWKKNRTAENKKMQKHQHLESNLMIDLPSTGD